jgi:hypothetical protein
MFAKLFPACCALVFLSAPGQAELAWKRPVQEFQCTPEDKSVDARFPFTNTGKQPVTVTSIKTSCGCTTARLEKKVYAPGESGEVGVTYSFRGQTGALRKLVTVKTDDRAEPTVLDIRVFRHEPFEVKPSLVFWRTGDAGEPKQVQLLANSYPVRVKGVSSSNPRVTASVQTVKEGEQYAVTVKPVSTAQKESAEITVTTDFPASAPRSYKIQARIK